MLQKIDTNNVSSDEGFRVSISVPQMLITYIEGERTAEIEIEGTVAPYGILVYADSISRWEPPHTGTAISQDDRSRILKNVTRALDLLGDTYKVD